MATEEPMRVAELIEYLKMCGPNHRVRMAVGPHSEHIGCVTHHERGVDIYTCEQQYGGNPDNTIRGTKHCRFVDLTGERAQRLARESRDTLRKMVDDYPEGSEQAIALRRAIEAIR